MEIKICSLSFFINQREALVNEKCKVHKTKTKSAKKQNTTLFKFKSLNNIFELSIIYFIVSSYCKNAHNTLYRTIFDVKLSQ